MYTRLGRRSALPGRKVHSDAGHWLRELRERRGLSQRELAAKVDAEYYTVISQLEQGRGQIPSDRYPLWAEALGVETGEFARKIRRYYDRGPIALNKYNIIFGREPRIDVSARRCAMPSSPTARLRNR
jgi:transcriptional regulator with XRE-family HTH domain